MDSGQGFELVAIIKLAASYWKKMQAGSNCRTSTNRTCNVERRLGANNNHVDTDNCLYEAGRTFVTEKRSVDCQEQSSENGDFESVNINAISVWTSDSPTELEIPGSSPVPFVTALKPTKATC